MHPQVRRIRLADDAERERRAPWWGMSRAIKFSDMSRAGPQLMSGLTVGAIDGWEV
jgi:hypothetical protein